MNKTSSNNGEVCKGELSKRRIRNGRLRWIDIYGQGIGGSSCSVVDDMGSPQVKAYEEFEKKCIASGEEDLVYLRAWWDKYWYYENFLSDIF